MPFGEDVHRQHMGELSQREKKKSIQKQDFFFFNCTFFKRQSAKDFLCTAVCFFSFFEGAPKDLEGLCGTD